MKPARSLPVCLLLLASAWCLALAQSDSVGRQREERLAKNAGLFTRFELGPPLEERRANPRGEIDLSPSFHYDSAVLGRPISPEQRFNTLARYADAIVEGTAEQRFSALTLRRSFVYSDWEVRVARVFKNVSSVPIVPGGLITVVQAGGRITINGRTVFAHLADLPEYALNQRYLLYLEALPDSESFRPAGRGFELTTRGPECIIEPSNSDQELRQFCASFSYEGLVAAVVRSVSE